MRELFKIIFFALFIFLMFSCKKNENLNDFRGVWGGNVLIVFVEYIFSDTEFTSKTLSFNNVLISGKKGKITSVHDNKIFIEEYSSYSFNTETNRGEWHKSTGSYYIEYTIKGKKMEIKPSYAQNSTIKSFTLEKIDK